MNRDQFSQLLSSIQSAELQVREDGQKEMDWRSIPGYEYYEASRCGQIRKKSAGIVAQYRNVSTGYMTVHLNRKTVNVHCVVACAFLGDRPHQLDINHIDGDKTNNNVCNLEYISRSQNMIHAYKKELPRHAALTEDQVRNIKRLRSSHSLSELAVMFNVSRGTIVFITTGKTWKWV